jgi:hypothetical protein
MSEKNKLATAAEALVQAAVSETTSSTLAITRQVADGIKDISVELKGFNEHTRTLAAIHSSVEALNVSISKMQKTLDDSIKSQTKQRRIKWALQSCKQGSFDYSPTGDYRSHATSSEELVRSILHAFRLGNGYYISLDMQMPDTGYHRSNEQKLASNQQFRDALTRQLSAILGVTPVWSEPEATGQCIIRYP